LRHPPLGSVLASSILVSDLGYRADHLGGEHR